VSFGTLTKKPRPAGPVAKFRLAVLGDLTGRANAGTLETGAALAKRKPIKVDVDNLETVMQRLKLSLSLPVGPAGDVAEIEIADMDAFHPDQLFDALEVFGSLNDLRKRLASRASFERAAKEVRAWGAPEVTVPPPPRPKPRGGAIPTDRKLGDFARLVGTPTARGSSESAVEDLVRGLVAPFILPSKDPKQDQLVAQVDAAMSAAMREVLHHPDFQSLESTWRSIELLVRRLETGAKLEIVLYDVSAEELAADVAASEVLEETGLYGLLAEQPALDANQGPISAVIGLYGFELTPPHADLLGRIAGIAAGAGVAFLSSIAPDALATPMHEQHPLIAASWKALHALPEAACLGLATPRFLLRMPYGKKTDPIDSFPFEEFTRAGGLSGMLWGNPAVLAGYLLAETYARQGPKMKLGSVMSVGEMPYYVYTDPDGDQVALPCTERLYSERQAIRLGAYKVMPVLCLRGRPEVRLGGFNALSGTPIAGFWAPFTPVPKTPGAAPAAAPEPEAEPEAAPEALAEPTPAAPAAEPEGGNEDG